MSDWNKKEVTAFLKAHHAAVVSTPSVDGGIDSAYVFYVNDEDLNLYFMTKEKTRKYSNITSSGKASFVVTDEEAMVTVQAKGDAEEITDMKEANVIFDRLLQLYKKSLKGKPAPISKLGVSDLSIFRIRPSWLRCADFSRHGDTTSDDCFSQII